MSLFGDILDPLHIVSKSTNSGDIGKALTNFNPFSSQASIWDLIGGGPFAMNKGVRTAGRAVGLGIAAYFGLPALMGAMGSGGSAAAGSSAAGAGTSGAYDATAAGIDAGGYAGIGGAGGVGSGMSGAVADGLASSFGYSEGASTITGMADSTFSGASPLVSDTGGGVGGSSPFLMSDAGSPSLASMGGGTGLTAPAEGGGVISAQGTSSAASDLGTSLSSGTVSNAALDTGTLTNVAGNPQTGGMLSSFMGWAKANPMLATGLVQTIGGLLNGIGQAKSQRELLQYQQQLAEQLAQWQRQFTQSGNYWSANVPVASNGSALTRPSGAPVYGSGGLISQSLAG